MLWSGFIPPKKQAERAGMRMSELVEHVSKKPIPPHVKNLLVEVMVANEDDEDVEVSVRRHVRRVVIELTSRCHMSWSIFRCVDSDLKRKDAEKYKDLSVD